MPATLTSRPAASRSVDLSAVSTEITTDATLDDGTERVAVQLSLPLSFAYVLGVVAFAPSDFLTYEAMKSPLAEAELRYAVAFALLNTSVFELHTWAVQAMAAYEGRAVGELAEFVRKVAPVVSRVFGFSAPAAA